MCVCSQCAASCRLHMASANYFCIIYSGSLTHSHTGSTPAYTCLHYCYNILFPTSHPLHLHLPPLGRSACSHLVQFPTTFGRLKFNSPSRLQKQFACATVCACMCVLSLCVCVPANSHGELDINSQVPDTCCTPIKRDRDV